MTGVPTLVGVPDCCTAIGLRNCDGGDQGDPAPMSFRGFKSDSELRRFFFVRCAGLVGVLSPIVVSVEIFKCELPGLDFGSSWDPEEEGRSREPGRKGGSIRVSISVDLDRNNEDAFDRLAGCDGVSLVCFEFLLRVRHTEATFDSDSDLLFSRLRLPNPNLLRSEEAFELREPVLKDLFRLRELPAVSVAALSSTEPWEEWSKRLS